MLIDYSSLLIAIGLSAAGLSVTLFIAWMSARTEGFMLSWSAAIFLIVLNVVAYSLYVENPQPLLAATAFGLLSTAFALMLGAAHQFGSGILPKQLVASVATGALIIGMPPFFFGFTGLGFLIGNTIATLLLFAVTVQYWRLRQQAPVQIWGMVILHATIGVSFALCAVMLVPDHILYLTGIPDNWAEDLSLVVVIIGLTGVGALSLALNQSRLAKLHKRDANTDPLTGLMNRRALFGRFGRSAVPEGTGVALFDIDRFKQVNDQHGHAMGDEVLRRFAFALRQAAGTAGAPARLGGEEFVVVLPDSSPEAVAHFAELVRARFAGEGFSTDRGTLGCTVSAGVVYVRKPGQSFDALLRQADNALYFAKKAGRNRVIDADLKLVA